MRNSDIHILFRSNEPEGVLYITMWAWSFEQVVVRNCENGMARCLLVANRTCGDWRDGGADEIFTDDFLRARIGFGDFIGENFGVGGLWIHAGGRGVGRLIDIMHVDGDDGGKPRPQRLFFELVAA